MADHPEVFDEIDHQVRVQFGLIDGEEASEQDTENKKDEAVQADSVNEEVTLDLGDELEIEIEE